MKIVYVVQSLSTHGGVEKILTLKANYLANKRDYNVSIITFDQPKQPIFFNLDKKVKVFHLDIGSSDSSKSLILRKLNNIKYYDSFLVKLTNLIETINPDITISLGGGELFIVNKLKDNSIKLAEYHVTMGYFLYYQNKEKNKLKKIAQNFSLRKFIGNLKKYEKFIVLTEGDRKEWSQYSNNVIKIPNFITMELNEKSSLQNYTAIAVGRFEPEKQFDHLILAWKEVTKKYPNWHLKLKGSGSQENLYRSLIRKHNLENNVFIIPPSESMQEFYLEASIYLMASRFEGFSLVILEALQVGLPVVSYNCKYGPAELVKDNVNGFLVEQDNVDELAQKVIKIVGDNDLRKKMGENSLLISKNYEKDTVMEMWMNLFDSLIRTR